MCQSVPLQLYSLKFALLLALVGVALHFTGDDKFNEIPDQTQQDGHNVMKLSSCATEVSSTSKSSASPPTVTTQGFEGEEYNQNDRWLTNTNLISDPPNIVLLQQPPISLFEKIVSEQLLGFGTLLLQDESGNKMKRIENDRHTEYERIREICRVWLAGKGLKQVTWATLIEVLQKTNLMVLADDVLTSVNKSVLNDPALEYAHSTVVLDAAVTLRNLYMEMTTLQFKYKFPSDQEFLDILLKNTSSNLIIQEKSALEFRRLLITGQPGAGKTTYIRHLAKKWAKYKTLQFCEILFLINLSEVKQYKNGCFSLLDLILSSTTKEDLKDIENIAKEITTKQGAGACFLIDAYDEWTRNDFVHTLFFENHLSESHCFLTSRPYDFVNDKLPSFVKQVTITGFDINNLELNLDKHCDDSTARNAILKLWASNANFREMCTLPLHFAMIVDMGTKLENEPIIYKQSQLYTAFMNATLKHYNKNFLPKFNTIHLSHCIMNVTSTRDRMYICEAFRELHRVAFEMTLQNVSTFPDEFPEIREAINKFGFVSIEKEDDLTGNQDHVRYTFSHPTFCEYFAALHLMTLPQEQQSELIAKFVHLEESDIDDEFLWAVFFGLLDDFSICPLPYCELLRQFISKDSKYVFIDFSKVCNLTVATRFLVLLLNAGGYPDRAFIEQLELLGIISKSSLCVMQTFADQHFIADIVKFSNIHTFQFWLMDNAVLITLKNDTYSLDKEYLRLMSLLMREEEQWTAFPSVISWSSDAFYLLSRFTVAKLCIMLEFSRHITTPEALFRSLDSLHQFPKVVISFLAGQSDEYNSYYGEDSFVFRNLQIVEVVNYFMTRGLLPPEWWITYRFLAPIKLGKNFVLANSNISNNQVLAEVKKILPNVKLLHLHINLETNSCKREAVFITGLDFGILSD